jgi:hypothetical protein
MPGLTAHESQILLARAIVEIVDGNPGAGVAYARNLAVLQDAGVLGDPHGLRQPPPTPKPPSLGEVITNRDLDNPRPETTRRAPLREGTNAWFDAILRRRAS